MDRELDAAFRRKRWTRRALWSAALIAFVIGFFVWGPQLLKPSVTRARVRTAKVEVGPIEAEITASGTVSPEFEQVISSPVNVRVLKILKRPGSILSTGEPILELDLNESRLAIEKLNQQIEIKQNQQSKAKLDLENTLIDLQGRSDIKMLEFKAARASTARNRALLREGLLSEERMREIELVEEKSGYELKQLEESRRNAHASTKTSLEGLALEMKTLEQERIEARRQLDLATTKSDRRGVLTWVVNEEGATVQKGQLLARIADLSAFRVEATVSDVHANRLSVGQPVKVKINDSYLKGAISRINPAVDNGAMTIFINLDDKANPLLRSNLRVDVLVVTERKDRTLRIKRGPFASGDGVRDVFVLRGDAAVRTSTQFGLASFDYFEVLRGLLEGDEVIISDMAEYQHLKELKLK
jgi:HlyD family secretion protein